MDTHILKKCIPQFGDDFIDEIESFGTIKSYTSKDFIVQQGLPVRHLPIVLEGTVKVFSDENAIDFLLYYIREGQPCIFSFAHLSTARLADFSAVPETEKVEILLLPVHKVKEWILKYPVFNTLIIAEYQKRYDDLLETTKQVVCYRLEERLCFYLVKKSEVNHSKILSISHSSIAKDLGTTREVISRLMKKLEREHKILQKRKTIEVLL